MRTTTSFAGTDIRKPLAALVICAGAVLTSSAAVLAETLGPQAVNTAELSGPSGKGRSGVLSVAVILKSEVLLDRAGFSPGVIDGKIGTNYQKAVAAFQHANGMHPSGQLDAQTWHCLNATSTEPVLIEYEIQPTDVKGPFNTSIPSSLEKQAALKGLHHTGPQELLAEKFHVEPALLTRLNPKESFKAAGSKILVPNVASKPTQAKVTKVVVSKTERTVRALDGEGKLIAFYPASVGSKERPSPSDTLAIRSVTENPTYRYSPQLNFKGVKAQHSFDIAAGPKNPVGSMWIDLGDGYGIHGTPAPQNIGKTESHGCIRLANWDATALGKMVRKGTRVDFIN